MRYWWLRSPSKLITTSTMCSSTRGPAIEPSLVTWPTSTSTVPRSLAIADQFERAAAHLRDRAGRALDLVGMHGLDRIDHQQRGRLHCSESGQDVAHRSRRRQPDRRIGQPQPLGAQPHLPRRFLAADIDRIAARARHVRGNLEQQGRLADAGIAAHQDRRAGHQPAAQRAVEFGKPAGPAHRRRAGLVERLESQLPPAR